ncbi:MAG TPA: tRNA pseudouridine(55) synthase TruB [Casimicrobiaceae bacterium]|nr:tRNA pseudouridine(55) synthase TruB [Casimicrobiaceae bacterium]
MSAPRRPPRRRIDGVLLLDKPAGITSNAALGQAKRLYNAEKAGHTGTLDPLASGLLPVCFGEATKFAQLLLDAPKRYRATLRFGTTTTTQDAEGEIVATRPASFDATALDRTLTRFTGRQLQVPPAHSALKFQGRPYYEYARSGVDIPRAAREIVIHALTLVEWRAPDAVVDVLCSKGTYVRSLAADLGEALGCGAHLAALRRTASGGFDIRDAHTIDALAAMSEGGSDRCLLPASALTAQLPGVDVDEATARRFLQGVAIIAPAQARGIVAVYASGALLGIADAAEGRARPRRVIVAGSAANERSSGELLEN